MIISSVYPRSRLTPAGADPSATVGVLPTPYQPSISRPRDSYSSLLDSQAAAPRPFQHSLLLIYLSRSLLPSPSMHQKGVYNYNHNIRGATQRKYGPVDPMTVRIYSRGLVVDIGRYEYATCRCVFLCYLTYLLAPNVSECRFVALSTIGDASAGLNLQEICLASCL